MPASFAFRAKAALRGYRVYPVTVEDDNHLDDILDNVLPEGGILVVSPYHSLSLPADIATDRRVIVPGAGGEGLPDNVETISMDRIESFRDLGEAARNFTDGQVTAVFNPSTPARQQEQSSFIEEFIKETDDTERLIILDLTESPGGTLPDSFANTSGESDLLVLLAGPENFRAFMASEENGTPVMGEYLLQSGFISDRIVLSLEDDPRAMAQTLLKALQNTGESGEKSYQTQVSRK